MDFHTVLDISAIIWDKDDYNSVNRHQYYGLMNSTLNLLDKLKKEQPKILIREELLNELINNFPFDELPDNFYAFGISVYDFLSTTGSNIITYPDKVTSGIISIPDLVKPHYNETTKKEVNYLISKIHANTETDNVYFTFQYLWDDNEDKLKTQVSEDIKEYDTIICDKPIKPDDDLTELDNFFAKFKRIFEHNPKHNKGPKKTREEWEKGPPSGWDTRPFISQLSCYNGEDDTRPQELLDSSVKFGDKYYNYDEDYDGVWVTFQPNSKQANNRDYHGYDEYDENKIPNKVRKHFNK